LWVGRKLKSADVIDVLSDLFILRGMPGHVRSDSRPEFAANAVKSWISGVGAKTAFIELGSPWEDGYVESFNGKLRDELLNMKVFITLAEAKVLIKGWRRHYNTARPHSSLNYRPSAPETFLAHCLTPPTDQNSSGSVQILIQPELMHESLLLASILSEGTSATAPRGVHASDLVHSSGPSVRS
jgi:putative transposase